MWRKLTEKEAKEFENHTLKSYKIGAEINPTWHPVCQAKCHQMNFEFWNNYKKEFIKE